MNVSGLSLPSVARAKFPVSYERAKEALSTCERLDECKEWADKAEAIASYAKQASDESLMHIARRIKARAIQRCGELVGEISPAKGGRPHHASSTSRSTPTSRADAARAAGLSKDQMIQALRVASLPSEEFEAAVEATPPATVSELASRGKKALTSPDRTRDQKKSRSAQIALRAFVDATRRIPAAVVVRGTLPHRRAKLAGHVDVATMWLQRLRSELEKSDAG